MSVPERDGSESVFKPRELSQVQIEKLCDLIQSKHPTSSVEKLLANGNKLKWFAQWFSPPKGGKKNCVFPAWVNEKDEPLRPWKRTDNRSPSLVLSMPAGPTKTCVLSVDSIYKFDPKDDAAAQKIIMYNRENNELDSDNKYDRYYKVRDYLDAFFNDDLATFLAYNLNDHEMLPESSREIGEKDPKMLYEQIKLAMKTRGNNTHHAVNIDSVKRKIFRDGEKNSKGAFIPGVCKVDELILDVLDDPSGRVRSFLQINNGAKRLNLMNLTLQDRSQVRPAEYQFLSAYGGCAALEYTCYGVYCRMEGGEPEQHTVMIGTTSAQMFVNGKPYTAAPESIDCMSILDETDDVEVSAAKSPEAETDMSAVDVINAVEEAEEEEPKKLFRSKRKEKHAHGHSKRTKVVFDDEMES